MNETVRELVERLFRGLADTEELRAVKEEVLSNCQARYEDMVNSGASPEEAIGAVRGSLRGMEELMAVYPKGTAAETEKAEGAETEAASRPLTFSMEGLRSLRASVRGFDVLVEESPDSDLHMDVTGPGAERIRLEREENALVLRELERDAPAPSADAFGKADSSLFGWLQGMLDRLQSLPGQILSQECGSVTLRLPRGLSLAAELETASGDLSWHYPEAEHLRLKSASGDLTLRAEKLQALRLETVSGDVRAEAQAGVAVLKSLSGDISWQGSCAELSLRSTSGDLEAAAETEKAELESKSGDISWLGACDILTLRSVSGDVRGAGSLRSGELSSVSGELSLDLQGVKAQELSCRSTSGDIRLRLPEALAADIQYSSVSGSVSCSRTVSPDGAPGLQVRLQTVSGSIRVL